MTFSLVAKCASSGMFGVAISSSSPAVAARCAFARANAGAVATQNVTDPRLGPQGLDLLGANASASEAISTLQKNNEHMNFRQVLIVDGNGDVNIHSGSESLGVVGEATLANVASAGNLLANENVPQAIVTAFDQSSGHLGDRLLIALRAGLDAGGEAGPVHSAGLLVVDQVSWPIVDLRCDWTLACPIDELDSAWREFKPQIEAYINRGLDPSVAPSYGVPGDD